MKEEATKIKAEQEAAEVAVKMRRLKLEDEAEIERKRLEAVSAATEAKRL